MCGEIFIQSPNGQDKEFSMPVFRVTYIKIIKENINEKNILSIISDFFNHLFIY